MAQLFKLNEKWPYPLTPSEYVQRQFHVQFQDDPVAIACRHITGLSTHRVGQRLPARRGHLPRQPGAASRSSSPASPTTSASRHPRRHPRRRSSASRPRSPPERRHRAPLRRARRRRHRRGARHRPRLRAPARRAGRQRRRQRPRAARWTGDGRRRRRRPPTVVAEIAAAGGDGDRRHQRRVDRRRRARRSSTPRSSGSGGSTSWSTTPGSCGGRASRTSTPRTSTRHLAVHVGGSFNTARAAWPHFVEQGYGRIVMTTSTGVLGLPDNTRLRHRQGRRHRAGPQPRHRRRRARHQGQPASRPPRPPAWPAAASGPGDAAGPGRADGRLPRPRGLPGQRRDLHRRRRPLRPPLHRLDRGLRPRRRRTPTIEDVAEHWAAINDEAGYSVPADLMDWSATFTAHLER